MFHHLKVIAKAWHAENERRLSQRVEREETDFLPAALEVMETPPSPIGRIVIWVIMAAAVSALVWACFSKVDEVAVAEGRLVPRGRLRTVEASVQGIIQSINVREGQHVKAGDTLIALDPMEQTADARLAAVDLSTASLIKARNMAILSYGNGGSGAFIAPQGANSDAIATERALVQARISEYRSKVASLNQRRIAAESAMESTQAEIAKLQQTLPLLKEQYDAEQGLAKEGFGARQKLLQTQQAYISAKQDLEVQQSHLHEGLAQVASIQADIAQARQEFLGSAAQERAEAESNVAERSETLAKANDRKARMNLLAPVSGTIQEVTITTIGETPEVGKPLVTLVADGDELVAEGLLMNRDAGFVHEGQPVTIKLDAYPFTRYGVIHGIVEHVSPDATVDEKRGLVFPIRVRITQSSLVVNGHSATLSAGMSAALEVVTGKRRVIEYLWSPVAKAVTEAGRER